MHVDMCESSVLKMHVFVYLPCITVYETDLKYCCLWTYIMFIGPVSESNFSTSRTNAVSHYPKTIFYNVSIHYENMALKITLKKQSNAENWKNNAETLSVSFSVIIRT